MELEQTLNYLQAEMESLYQQLDTENDPVKIRKIYDEIRQVTEDIQNLEHLN